MARRSPTNARYQKHAKIGSTRRSAASAKPKRERAQMVTKSKSAAAKKPSTGRGLPDVPEVRFYNRLYIALFAVALLSLLPMVLVPVFAQYVLHKTVTVDPAVTAVLWGVYAAAIGGALYVQTGPLRKLKAAALRGELPSQQAAAAAKSGKARKAEKASADEGDVTGDGKDA